MLKRKFRKEIINNTNEQHLQRIGQILELNGDEINKMIRKKKKTLIIAILLTILATIMLSGCIHTLYTSVSLLDFSGIWRLF